MNFRIRRPEPVLLLAALVLAAGSFATPSSAAPKATDQKSSATPDRPRAEMQKVFEAVANLLPIALSEQGWSDPARRPEIQRWIDALAERSVVLEQHGMQRDAGFRHLSRALSADIEEVRERYRAGRFEESRFFMIEATGNCVACHSRLPDSTDFQMADTLIDRIEFDSLSTHEQTQILVATRQFERAMTAWEQLFADASIPPAEFDLGGYILDYMTIGLRVESDPARVSKTLATLASRPDVPLYLRRHLDSWVVALNSTADDLASSERLERARSLVGGQRLVGDAPLARDQTVYDLVASSLLLQFVDEPGVTDLRRAEAYYLLGLVESRTIDSHWVPQAEVHLESAIRLAPETAIAENAYAVLEEYVIIGWGGASSVDLPADQWAKLRELRELIDQRTAAPGQKRAK